MNISKRKFIIDDELVSKCNLSELVSDHYAISFHVEYIKPILPKKLIT